ncbi:MAG: TPM domain-containing protein [Denitratisoma sp.]|nr:TPM domain-containing protein [Denitratisoma sp.]
MVSLSRLLRHLLTPDWQVGKCFPARVMQAVEASIAASETRHAGEIRFAVEAGLPLASLLHGETARLRAVEVFSRLRVWDTENNSGVLIYVQLVDREVEILADRGINALVPQAEWDAICHRLEESYRNGNFEQGTIAAIEEIGIRLARHFPPLGANPNELPDRPAIL